MTIGIGIRGDAVVIIVGGAAIIGTTSKGTTWTNELGETTDDAASGWAEFMATPLKKSGEFTISGILKNLELVKAYFNTSQAFEVVETHDDGSTVTYDAVMSTIAYTGESVGLVTFDASFSTSGIPAFVAGT